MPFYCQGQSHPKDCRCPIGNREPHAYNPFKRNGQPKLTYLRSRFQREGWLVLTKVKFEKYMCGTVLHGVVLDSPTMVDLGVPQQLQFDPAAVYVYRKLSRCSVVAELKALPVDDPEADGTILDCFSECGTEIELLARTRRDRAA